MTFCGLRFGATLEQARGIGKPDDVELTTERVNLLYARSGFELEFQAGAFSSVAFFIALDEHTPDYQALRFASPSLTLRNGDVCELNDKTTAELLVDAFGKPADTEMSDEEALMYWEVNGVTVEAELFTTNQLKRLSFWPLDGD